MKIPILLLFLVTTLLGVAQNISFPDEEARFPGGAAKMKRFIQMELHYPEAALQNWDQGRLYVTFIVEKNGRLSNIEVTGGGLTHELNIEAVRIISAMPKWIPGRLDGVPVRVRCRLPITFNLGEKSRRRIRKQHRQNRMNNRN